MLVDNVEQATVYLKQAKLSRHQVNVMLIDTSVAANKPIKVTLHCPSYAVKSKEQTYELQLGKIDKKIDQ